MGGTTTASGDADGLDVPEGAFVASAKEVMIRIECWVRRLSVEVWWPLPQRDWRYEDKGELLERMNERPTRIGTTPSQCYDS
jgi:hypothetical protein